MQDHSIDLIPEYTGNLLQYFDKKTQATTPDAVLLALFSALPGDLSILTPSPGRGQGHPRRHRGHRAALEPEDHRRSRARTPPR